MPTLTIEEELQSDANDVAEAMAKELANIPRKFVDRVTTTQIRQYSINPEGNAPEECGRAFAKEIATQVQDGQSLQFIRHAVNEDYIKAAYSEDLETPLVTASAAYDLRQRKILKRFDVWYVIHEDPKQRSTEGAD